ncbi:hypothetical protein KW790_02770 [Candidatus Parcubacteria bacterium]|nr:hypothetical protein [Candidatus Parcubacteria bacterium]
MSFENPETSNREILIEALKTKGLEDPETREMLIKWTEDKENEVEREGTRDAQINFELERAQLYLDAGYTDDAMQTLKDAMDIATNENRDDLVELVQQKIDSLQ